MKAVPIMIAVLACAVAVEAGSIRVRSIELRGAKYLTVREILRGVSMAASNGTVAVDASALDRSLSRNPMITTYSVRENDGVLIITVEEREPVLAVAVTDGPLFEMGATGAILAAGAFHNPDAPVLRVPRAFLPGGKPTAELRTLTALLLSMRRKHPALYGQIAEISPAEEGLEIILRGRRTRYYAPADEGGFIRLKYVAGYFDRAGRAPGAVYVSGNAAAAFNPRGE